MSTLIRFEDRYGMATVVQQMCMLLNEGADVEAMGYLFDNAKGIPGVLKIKEPSFNWYYTEGVRRILFVFDLDGDNGSVHQLVNLKQLERHLNILEAHRDRSGTNIQLEYVPTVYMAETIALYQEFNKLNVIPELCVNKYSFKTLQVSLLRVLFQLDNERTVKRFSEYLIPDRIIKAARLGCSVFNTRLFEILLNLEVQGYNKEETLEHCRTAVQLFDACMEADISINADGYKFTNSMTVEDMRQQVTNYLINIGKKQRR